MKIANIVRRFSFEEWGGTETVVWNAAKCLAQSDCVSDILCTRALSMVAEEEVNDVYIRRFPYFYPYFPLSRKNRARLDKKGGNPYSFALMNYLKKSDYDILHCHTMARIAETVKLTARSRNIPYVVSFHGGCYDVPETEQKALVLPVKKSFNYGKFFDIFFKFDGRFIDDADGIICVGFNEYEITRKRFPNKLVEYIPNGVEVEKFNIRPEVDFRVMNGIPEDRKIVLCVSRIDYQKNQKRLIDFAVKMIRAGENLHCVIIGPVTADYYGQEVRDMITDNRIRDRVTIIEGLSPESRELVAAYHAADLFVLPSLHEPFGIVVLEAWSAGVPVIAAEVGGLKKLITGNQNGVFFDPESTDGLIEAYHRIFKNPSFREQLVNNGLQTVRENYTWTKITEKLLNFYKKVLDEYKSKK
jgi:glycosyltransferase involved in cell wall biosynthesis